RPPRPPPTPSLLFFYPLRPRPPLPNLFPYTTLFRSVVGVLAITIALGLVTIAARYTAMSVFVLNITTMVGLGVGIDYSLLIVTRFREELNRGLSPVDAAIRTVETAGSAVVTSGLTVVVGFAA